MKKYLFDQIIVDSTSKFHKIKKEDYLLTGQYKIVDQSKDFIAGYTNDKELVNSLYSPLIIFGDHTKIFKYVDFPLALGADGAKALTIKNNLADSKYLYYYFKTLKLNDAGYSRHFKFLKEVSIPLPENYADQIRIAAVLTRAEKLIVRRKASIKALDELLKSTFLEMFGDIMARKSIHPWEKLRPYLTAQSGKSSKGVLSAIKTDFPIYGGNGINGWATKPLFLQSVVIAGRVGQQCGVIYVSKGPCWVTDNAIVLRIKDNTKLNSIYLAYAFTYSPILEKVKQLDLPFINQPMLLDIKIPMPKIASQIKFAAIVEKVELLKARSAESLTELEKLYGALSQRAFKGELDLSRVPAEIA